MYDIPLLRDQDSNPGGTGYYFAAWTPLISQWPGAVLFKSTDDSSFEREAPIPTALTNYGKATTILAVPRSPWTWDDVNTLTVSMKVGILAGIDDLAVLNGANALLVGGEVVQYGKAVQNMDGTFTIRHLLRGRRGTEWACGAHGSNEDVVDLLHGGIFRVQKPLSYIALLRYYRAVTVGGDITAETSRQFTITGRDLMPYAPVHIAGSRDGSSNLTITWLRRTRIGGAWLDGQGDVPLSEDAELYDVEILNGATVVRTFSNLSSPTASYSAADQTADFGSPQAAVAVKIYQRSAQIGRGFPGTATI